MNNTAKTRVNDNFDFLNSESDSKYRNRREKNPIIKK